MLELGLATDFFPKIPWNRLGTVFVIPLKKVLISRHSEVYGRVNFEARNEMELHEQICFTKKSYSSKQNWDRAFVSEMLRNWIPSDLLLYLLHRTEFRVVVFSAECFRTEFREFVLFFCQATEFWAFFLCRMVRHGIPRVFSSAEQPEPEQTFCSFYSAFCGIIFLRKLPTLVGVLIRSRPMCPRTFVLERWVPPMLRPLYNAYVPRARQLMERVPERFVPSVIISTMLTTYL